MRDGRNFHFIFGFIFVFMFTFTKLTIVSATTGNRRVDHSKCTLQPESERMKLQLERKIDQDNRLIKLDITVQWNSYPANDSYPNKMLWFLTADATGKHLMSLDDDFIVLSLGTLSYRITDLRISLVQEPEDCLGILTPNDADELLKYALLNLPKSQKAVNEEEINIFHICTDFAESGGSCCNLSLTGRDIRCQKLVDDTWVKNYAKVVFILTLIIMSHSIYLIPSFVFEEDNDHSYKLDKNLKIRVHVHNNVYNATTKTDVNKESSLINKVCKMSKENNENTTFDLFVESVKRRDTELVSELGNFRLIQSLYKPFEYIYLKYNLSKRKYLNRLFKICIILFFTSPIIFRTYLSFCIHSDISPFLLLLLTLLVILFVFACTFLSGETFPNHEVIKTSLREFFKHNFHTKTEMVANLACKPFSEKSIGFGILCGVVVLIKISFLLVLFSLPVCFFFFIFMDVSKNQTNRTASSNCNLFLLSFVFSVCSFCGLFIFALCAVFFANCIAYILIGLFLNYEQVIDTVLLIIMILIYIVDCLLSVHKKIEYFHQTVLNLMFEFDKTREYMFSAALEKNENTAMEFKLNDKKIQNVEVNIGDDGKPFLSFNWLYLYYKKEKSDELPFLHIPHSFFDKLTSKPGHTTPGRTYILLLNACREILFLFLAMLAVYFIIHGFTRNNDISDVVHTLVTLSSSAAMAKFIKLLFRSSESSLKCRDLHLKEYIKRQLENSGDIWFDAEFKCLDQMARTSDDTYESQAVHCVVHVYIPADSNENVSLLKISPLQY